MCEGKKNKVKWNRPYLGESASADHKRKLRFHPEASVCLARVPSVAVPGKVLLRVLVQWGL